MDSNARAITEPLLYVVITADHVMKRIYKEGEGQCPFPLDDYSKNAR
jgi:hypothetical protein